MLISTLYDKHLGLLVLLEKIFPPKQLTLQLLLLPTVQDPNATDIASSGLLQKINSSSEEKSSFQIMFSLHFIEISSSINVGDK